MTRIPAHLALAEDTSPVFDHRHIAYVFNQRGYTINEIASRLDMSNHTLEDILRGAGDPGELRIATLRTLANLLGIPLRGLFAQPDATGHQPPSTPTGPSVPHSTDADSDDAHQLIASVYDRGRVTPTPVRDIAAAFGWTLDHTYAIAKQATDHLRPAGLRVNTSHGELFITPIGTHLEAIEALEARRTYQRGLHHGQYRIVHALITDPATPIPGGQRARQITLGGLVNQGIVDNAKKPSLTAAVRDAFPDRTWQ